MGLGGRCGALERGRALPPPTQELEAQGLLEFVGNDCLHCGQR